jgi:DNA-binding transcriptional ArsR family regulator
MPRAATSSDVWNAVAEPHRREILELLAPDERSVGDVVGALGLAQPSVSKHLRVLRSVGLVRSRRDGRRILYRTNTGAIMPLYEWAGTFERYWGEQLRRIKERAESTHRSGLAGHDPPEEPGEANRQGRWPPPSEKHTES